MGYMHTFCMIGKMASFFVEASAAEASPFGRCESGTRTGLCLRIDRFFCDLPMFDDPEGVSWIRCRY